MSLQAETGSNCFDQMTRAHWEQERESHKSKPLNVLPPRACRADKRRPLYRIIPLWAAADGQMAPFYHFTPEPSSVLSTPDQSFKSVKVSKFIARGAYMWLTCTQGEHLHVFELQRGVGWVQSLAVVCHVHVCQCFGQTKSQLPDSGAERLVQEANVTPPLTPFSHLHPSPPLPYFEPMAPPRDKVAPWPTWEWWGPTGVR